MTWSELKTLSPLIYIDPKRYGAKGDGIADDTIPLQNAINQSVLTGLPIRSTGAYKITATLTIDFQKWGGWDLLGGAIVYDGAGIALKFIGSGLFDIGFTKPMKNFNLYGHKYFFPLDPGTGTGIFVGDAIYAGFTANGAWLAISNININGFNKGIEWGNNSWMNSISDYSVANCTYAFYWSAGLINSDVPMFFSRGDIHNNAYGIYALSGGDLRFQGITLDYNSETDVYARSYAQITLSDVHFEFNTDTAYRIDVNDPEGAILINRGSIWVAGNRTNFPFGINRWSEGATFSIQSMSLGVADGSMYGFNYLVEGTGHFGQWTTKNSSGLRYETKGANPIAFSGDNLIQDGIFAGGVNKDTYDSGVAYSTVSNDQAWGTSLYSLKQAPAVGEDIYDVMTFPASAGDVLRVGTRLYGVGATADKAIIYTSWLDFNGNELTGSQEYDIDPAAAWTLYQSGPDIPAPVGTAWARIELSKGAIAHGVSDGVGAIYWSDLNVEISGSIHAIQIQAPPVAQINKDADFNFSFPSDHVLEGIRIKNRGNAITGGLDIWIPSPSATTNFAVGAGANMWIPGSAFPSQIQGNERGKQSLYMGAHTAWNAAILDCVFYFRKSKVY